MLIKQNKLTGAGAVWNCFDFVFLKKYTENCLHTPTCE